MNPVFIVEEDVSMFVKHYVSHWINNILSVYQKRYIEIEDYPIQWMFSRDHQVSEAVLADFGIVREPLF